MKIAIGNDHATFNIRDNVISYLEGKGHEIIDMGAKTKTTTHYPIYGRKVALAVVKGIADVGIVICGTGVGIGNAASKIKGTIVVHTERPSVALKARREYGANIIAFGARSMGIEIVKSCLDSFLSVKKQKISNPKRVEMLDKKIERLDDNAKLFDKEIAKWEVGTYTRNIIQKKVER